MTQPSLSVILTTVALSSVLVAVAACSSDPEPPNTGGTSGTSGGRLGDDDDTPAPSGGTSGTSGTSGSTTTPPRAATDEECVAKNQQCQQCCATDAHKTGSDAYDVSLKKCICTTPGACQTECATTFCAAQFQTPDAACNTCIRGAVDGACSQQLRTECNAVPDCPLLYDCINKCP
jgi:hypothetical protein